MLDVYGPVLVYRYLGYPVVAVAAFALWRPSLASLVALLLGAFTVFRLVTLFLIARALRRILMHAVGARATVVGVPRRGDILVDVDGRQFAAMVVARNPNRPKVGQHVAVLMDRNRSTVLVFLG